jgi:lipopolysaccharide/colanic/teichoic acid biosynthesis glycosyltransferase
MDAERRDAKMTSELPWRVTEGEREKLNAADGRRTRAVAASTPGEAVVEAPIAPPPAPPLTTETHSPWMLAAKRAFDVVGSLLALIILAPIWILIAVMIKLDTPGPVLFRQPRVGRDGRVFAMLKFRTMIRDADQQKLQLLHLNEAGDGLFKIRDDPRLTRFGRFLRTTSLDELPQLIHVLTGRMSLVGPRPLVSEEDGMIDGRYRRRLEMRPGMTGRWQVAGASRIPMNEMVVLDYDYVRDWSLLGDVKLLVGTVPHVVLRRGM